MTPAEEAAVAELDRARRVAWAKFYTARRAMLRATAALTYLSDDTPSRAPLIDALINELAEAAELDTLPLRDEDLDALDDGVTMAGDLLTPPPPERHKPIPQPPSNPAVREAAIAEARAALRR